MPLPSSTPNPPLPPDAGIWRTRLTDTCLDDITLAPGAAIPANLPDHPPIPVPDYLSHEGRDLRIDLLRGYFVFAMIVDHVRGNSPLYLITGGNRFYTSAAEGFIFTSGLVAGLVYHRLIQRDGMSSAMMKVIQRAFTIFLLTISLTLSFSIFSEALGLPWAQGIDFSNPLGFVISIFTLHRTYYLVDVLLLYSVLFLVSPLAFVMLDRGKTMWLLGGSLLLYTLYQFYPAYANLPWNISGNYLFSFSAWQILFFTGLALGYHNRRIPALGCRETRLGLWGTGVGLVVLIILFYLIDPPTSAMPAEVATGSPVFHEVRLWMQEYLFSKVDLRPGRLIATAITLSFLFFSATHFWRFLRKYTGWLLLPLGQHALNAYTFHVILVGLVALALAPLKLEYPGPQLLNAAIQIASVLIIWFITKNQFLTPTPRTRLYWNWSPAAIAVLVVVILWQVPMPARAAIAGANAVDPGTNRVPTRYGTPIPPEEAIAPAISPTAEDHPTVLPGTDILSTPYMGPIEGSLHERWLYSPELNRDMPYYVYLPPDYDTNLERRYPVLYMLHGRGGHREEWVAYDLINVADREIRTGNLQPMIIILPQGDKDYWVDHIDNGPRWGQYLIKDIVGHIDANYRTLTTPRARAIGGLSMGGWGALHHAFLHPDLFGVVGAHSPSLRPDDGSLPFLGTGIEFARKDPVQLAATATGINALQIWVDTGEADPWTVRMAEMHNNLKVRGIDHVWQVYAGGHLGSYWHEHALDYLRYYGNALLHQ